MQLINIFFASPRAEKMCWNKLSSFIIYALIKAKFVCQDSGQLLAQPSTSDVNWAGQICSKIGNTISLPNFVKQATAFFTKLICQHLK